MRVSRNACLLGSKVNSNVNHVQEAGKNSQKQQRLSPNIQKRPKRAREREREHVIENTSKIENLQIFSPSHSAWWLRHPARRCGQGHTTIATAAAKTTSGAAYMQPPETGVGKFDWFCGFSAWARTIVKAADKITSEAFISTPTNQCTTSAKKLNFSKPN